MKPEKKKKEKEKEKEKQIWLKFQIEMKTSYAMRILEKHRVSIKIFIYVDYGNNNRWSNY